MYQKKIYDNINGSNCLNGKVVFKWIQNKVKNVKEIFLVLKFGLSSFGNFGLKFTQLHGQSHVSLNFELALEKGLLSVK